jgi:NAD(P)-dependent dehydrogenase (short-subunit alcohol dehydrogenase family)
MPLNQSIGTRSKRPGVRWASRADVQSGLFDVGDHDAVCRIADRIAAHFGTLDIVVNNAGVVKPTPLLEISPAQWDETDMFADGL